MPRAKKQHLKRRADGRFACRYRDQWFYGATEDEALRARDAYKRDEARRQAMRVSPDVTVDVYASEWLPIAKPDVSDCTYGGLATILNKLIVQIGALKVSEVVPTDIKRVFSTAYTGKSSSYIRSARQLYTALFDAAVSDGILQRNPVRDKTAAPHRGTYTGHRAVTQQERTWILTHCRDHRAWPAVMAMLYAGLRPPEAKAFNVDTAVDFEHGEIRLVDFAHIADSNHYAVTGRGKNAKAARTIPLFGPLREALTGRSGLLVTNADGTPITISGWKRLWNSYVSDMEKAINGVSRRWYGKTKEQRVLAERGELPPWQPFTVRPYDLRHSFATMCRDYGVEMNTVVQWMGHTDATMILRIYDEVTNDRSQREAERLEKLLNGSQIRSQEAL